MVTTAIVLCSWGFGGCGGDEGTAPPAGLGAGGDAVGGGGATSAGGKGGGGAGGGTGGGGGLPADTSGRIQPETDLVYLGAFRMPEVSANGTN